MEGKRTAVTKTRGSGMGRVTGGRFRGEGIYVYP